MTPKSLRLFFELKKALPSQRAGSTTSRILRHVGARPHLAVMVKIISSRYRNLPDIVKRGDSQERLPQVPRSEFVE